MNLNTDVGSKACRYEASFGRRIVYLCKAKWNEIDAGFSVNPVGIQIGQFQNLQGKRKNKGKTMRHKYFRSLTNLNSGI